MTRSELLHKMPALDFSSYNDRPPGGAEIPHDEALLKIGRYTQYNNDNGLNQTFSIGFASENLILWMLRHRARIDEIKVCMALDDEGKFTVVFWPYKDGLPAITDEAEPTSAALSTYNVGSRQPIFE